MESGQFSRGAKSFAADASVVFTGNLDVDDDRPDEKYRHLFEPLPGEMIDSALIDRIHGYLPGWEIPKITGDSLAKGVGLVTDYFGETLVKMRDLDFQPTIRDLGYATGMTRRDQVAVERISSGLIKLLYPDGRMTADELQEVATLASELRQRVHNQLAEIAPGEFKPRLIGWRALTEHGAADLRGPSRNILPQDDRLNREAVVGAVTGMEVIVKEGVEVGGDLILIQVSAFTGAAGVDVTGLHGRVMKDSVQTAYNLVRARHREFGIPERRVLEQRVAVHLVRIAEPKEGPSAGVAFIAGIVSALTGRPVKPACAMTGEVTLHGEVTRVAGIIQKIVAAARAGRKTILIPAENAKDIAKVPEDVLSRVNVMPIRVVAEAINSVLGEIPVPSG